jgi:hypothetical protein
MGVVSNRLNICLIIHIVVVNAIGLGVKGMALTPVQTKKAWLF